MQVQTLDASATERTVGIVDGPKERHAGSSATNEGKRLGSRRYTGVTPDPPRRLKALGFRASGHFAARTETEKPRVSDDECAGGRSGHRDRARSTSSPSATLPAWRVRPSSSEVTPASRLQLEVAP